MVDEGDNQPYKERSEDISNQLTQGTSPHLKKVEADDVSGNYLRKGIQFRKDQILVGRFLIM